MNILNSILELLWTPFEMIGFFIGGIIKPDSLITEPQLSEDVGPTFDPDVMNDSVRALGTLGMPKKRAEEIVFSILSESPELDIEGIIKAALKRRK